MSTRTAVFMLDEAHRAHKAGVYGGAILCAAAAARIQLMTEIVTHDLSVADGLPLDALLVTVRDDPSADLLGRVADLDRVASALSSYVEPFSTISLEGRERVSLIATGVLPATEEVLRGDAAEALDTAETVLHLPDRLNRVVPSE